MGVVVGVCGDGVISLDVWSGGVGEVGRASGRDRV